MKQMKNANNYSQIFYIFLNFLRNSLLEKYIKYSLYEILPQKQNKNKNKINTKTNPKQKQQKTKQNKNKQKQELMNQWTPQLLLQLSAKNNQRKTYI